MSDGSLKLKPYDFFASGHVAVCLVYATVGSCCWCKHFDNKKGKSLDAWMIFIPPPYFVWYPAIVVCTEISLCNRLLHTAPCVRVFVHIKVEQQRITVDTVAALESDNPTSSHLFHLSLSSLSPSPSLLYSLPGSSAEASTITATSTCLLTVSNGDRRLRRREGEDSGLHACHDGRKLPQWQRGW